MSQKTLLCLATAKGLGALGAVKDISASSDVIVCTFTETHTEGDSDIKILELARELGCQTISWNEVRYDLISVIERENIQAVIAIGWRYLLPMSIQKLCRYGILVFHDSLLPKYRGFAPLATAILTGEKISGLTVLHAMDEVDAGDVIFQREMPLFDYDTIDDAIKRIIPLFRNSLRDILESIRNGETLPRSSQNHDDATYSIWRSPEDGEIDWDQDSVSIDRLVRSAGYPYSGAFTEYEGKKIFVQETKILENMNFEIRQPGKIWQMPPEGPIIVCGRGMIQILSATNEDGSSHLPPPKLRVRYGIR